MEISNNMLMFHVSQHKDRVKCSQRLPREMSNTAMVSSCQTESNGSVQRWNDGDLPGTNAASRAVKKACSRVRLVEQAEPILAGLGHVAFPRHSMGLDYYVPPH